MENGLVYTHGFLVDDVNASAAFYETTLGYAVQRRTPTFVALDTQSPTGLFLWEYDPMRRALGAANMELVKHRAMLAMLYETGGEVDARFAELVENGMRIVAAPRDWEWNAYAGYLVDPEGFLLEIWAWKDGRAGK